MSKQLKRWIVFLMIFNLSATLCLPNSAVGQKTSAKTVSERYYEVATYEAAPEMETDESEQKDIVPEGYIGIYDIRDLYNIHTNLSAKYILMKDIDMSVDTAEGGIWNLNGHGWNPIEYFRGELDGNGHRIIGMHIYGNAGRRVGLFADLWGGTVKKLGMVDVSIDVNYDKDGYKEVYIGGIAGEAYSNALIEECYTTGNIRISDFKTGKYKECSIGGILGCGSITIKNVYNACDITVDEVSYVEAGGICGRSSGGDFSYSYNYGIISGVTDRNTYPICYNGYYEDEDYEEVRSYGNVQYCYYLSGTANKNQDTGCASLTGSQLRDERILFGFDFDNVWTIEPYCTYLFPQLINNRQIRISSLNIVTASSKTEYEPGDTLDISGLAVKVTYEDKTSTTFSVSEDMVSGYDMNVIGKQNVIISYGGASTKYSINVKGVSLTGIALEQSKVSLERNQTLQLTVLYTPADASDETITWTTSDATIAAVNEHGLVTGKNKGTATITATSAQGLTAQCEVEVLIPCALITLSETSANMKIGDTLSLTAQMLPLETTDWLEWKSDNTAVADVINGNVSAYSEGTANIIAYVEGGVSAVCIITVNSNAATDEDGGSDNNNVTTDKDNDLGNDNDVDSITSVKGKINSIKNVKTRSIKLKLGKLTSAQGYQIEYSLKSNFNNSKKIKRTSSTIIIKKLKKNKKYYVRVRVYGKVNGKTYYGKWSAKKAIKIKK